MTGSRTITRRSLLGIAASAGAASLAGCNLGAGGGQSGGKASATLNVWGGVPNESGPDDMCKAFMDEHPGVTVTYTRYVNDDQGNLKLDTSLSGGVPIDLYFSYGPVPMFKRSAAGLALDLTDKIKAESDFAALTPDADPLSNYVLDGKLYGLPAARAPQQVYINKSMLDAAGITLGKTWTVDEFNEVARKLTKPGVFGTLTAPPLARPTLGPNYLYAGGGKRSNFGNKVFAEELELALRLQKAKIAMDRQTIIAEKLQTFSQNPFIAGRVAMLIQSGQIIRSINDTKGYPHKFATYCMPVPVPAGSKGWNTGQIGDQISISPKSTFQDQAWELAKFWARNAGKYMTRGGRLPLLAGDSTPDQILERLLGPQRETLYDVASWKSTLFETDLKLPVDTIFTAGTEISTITGKLTDETLLGDRTVSSWVTEATRQSDAAIAKAGK
ncbi:multiple sugar transport system substrate-binding protein [Kribbella steppae]|uniref:Multiple sugar transport system substrate-binding protein n=1 Tax=Kribbella steppae TaxID=2512223 RepID=A0A4R2GZW5_9ACTN|nr:extracellular solute-binding protein [Kribbella steppae]TCO15683.1 multiple sugar transport system substrate-binding protein [Kribbella steppae]